MKIRKENKKKLSTIKKALLWGIPLSGITIAAGSCLYMASSTRLSGEASSTRLSGKASSTRLSGVPPEPPEQNQTEGKSPAKTKEISLDPMSLFLRRHSTPGIMYPSLIKIKCKSYEVQESDTWENLAYKKNTTVELLLRVNNISAERVWKIIEENNIPDDLVLQKGTIIFIPIEIQGDVWAACYYYGPEDTSDKALRFVLLPPKSSPQQIEKQIDKAKEIKTNEQ